MQYSAFTWVAFCLCLPFLIAFSSPKDQIDHDTVSSSEASPQLIVEDAQDDNLNTATTHTPKSSIKWAKPGFAPLFIASGKDQGQGIGDQLFAQIQAIMPEYQHLNLRLNYSRLFAEFRKGEELCAVLHHKPEREAFLVYSRPVMIYPTYQLYISEAGHERFVEKTQWAGQPMSFDHIMANSQGLKLLITPSQSYGVERDEILARHAGTPDIVKSYADKEAVVKMLAANRMDMTLNLPLLINYRVEQHAIQSQLIKVPLNDVGRYDKSHIACSDTPLGRKVVKAIDAMSPAIHNRGRDLIARWLTVAERETYYEIFDDYFLEGKPLP